MKKSLPEQGQHISVQCENLVVTCCHSMPRHQTTFCSFTNTQPNKTACHEEKKGWHTDSLICLKSVVLYNKHVSGINCNDQLRLYYHVRLKCRKYYKYIIVMPF